MRELNTLGRLTPLLFYGGRGAVLPEGCFIGKLWWGEWIYMPKQEYKEPWNDSAQAQLERLYLRAGRGDSRHRLHGSYFGLQPLTLERIFGWVS